MVFGGWYSSETTRGTAGRPALGVPVHGESMDEAAAAEKVRRRYGDSLKVLRLRCLESDITTVAAQEGRRLGRGDSRWEGDLDSGRWPPLARVESGRRGEEGRGSAAIA